MESIYEVYDMHVYLRCKKTSTALRFIYFLTDARTEAHLKAYTKWINSKLLKVSVLKI